MCTVTYIPSKSKSGFILTSNRDERVQRETIAPRVYNVEGMELCYPKDVEAGGSWIAANNNGRLACLLNGAIRMHTKEPHHTHSRGKVLIDLVSSIHEPLVFFSYYNLSHTEPFTVVTIDLNKDGKILAFTEFIWDGTGKSMKNLNADQTYLWSSATLYSASERELRKEWFDRFIMQNNSKINPEKVYGFHSGTHTNDDRLNLVMKRTEELQTVSITQVTAENGIFNMKYYDLVKNTTHVQSL